MIKQDQPLVLGEQEEMNVNSWKSGDVQMSRVGGISQALLTKERSVIIRYLQWLI